MSLFLEILLFRFEGLYASRIEFSTNDGRSRPSGSTEARYAGLCTSQKLSVLKLSAMNPALVRGLPFASNTCKTFVLVSRKLSAVNSYRVSTRSDNLEMSFIVNRRLGMNVLTTSERSNVYAFNVNLYRGNVPAGTSGSRGSIADCPRTTCNSPNPTPPRLSVAFTTRTSVRGR